MATGEGGSLSLQLVNTVLFVLLRSVNYLQMLVVMTYNIWLILALVLAQGIFSFSAAIIRDKQLL